MQSGTFPYRSRRIAIVNMPTRHYGLEGTMFPDWVVEFHVKSINTMKSERALREIHKYQADNVFGHLYDRVLHIEGHDFHNRMQRMKLFLEKKDCNVALCLWSLSIARVGTKSCTRTNARARAEDGEDALAHRSDGETSLARAGGRGARCDQK